MSKVDMYKGQADNIAAKIESKVSDLMQTVKKHPSMKKYSPHVRKGVQKEIEAILNNRMTAFSLKIDDDDINQWLNEYTPYAQASTTAYIQRVAKEKGFKTLTPEQVDYVKNALLNSMEPDEYFDWSTGTGVKIPLHGKALGTERDLAAKVATHVEWSVKKTVGNALKPENVIAFLVKNKKSLGIDNIDDIDMKYVDNVISVASMSLYGESNSKDRKITERSIQNIDNALLHAAFTANTNMSDFSGALLRKIGTSTFVNNDTRLGEIKEALDKKIAARARENQKNQKEAQNYARLRALMDRFFTALRWSMHYKTGKMGTSTYTAENQYMKIELAILEFVANTTLPLAELVSRFEKIFASNDNPEAVERLYMTEVLNAWWVNVSKTLGIDEDIALEIQSDIVAEKSGEYVEGNAGHFERDIDREKEIQASFKTLINDFRNGTLGKAEDNTNEIAELVKKYVQAKKEADLWKKDEAAYKRSKKAKDKKEGRIEVNPQIDEEEEEEKMIAKERAKERRDTKKRLQDKVIDNFKAANMQNAKEVGIGERAIKVLDKATLNKLKYTLFGTNKELTKGDFSKFLSAAYRVSGANDKGTRDLFIATHSSLINAVFNDDDVFNKDISPKFEKRFNNAKTSLLNYDEKLKAEKQKEKDKADREIQKAEKEKQKEKDEANKKRQRATQIDIKAAVNAGKENRELKREKDKAEKAENARLTAEKNKADRERQREINRAEKARLKAEEARQKAEEAANRNTAMTNFIRSSTSNFDADLNKIRGNSNRYLQQTTSRLKIDVVRKIGDSKLTKDLRTYRAAKKERHKAIVNSSVSDFITKANESLNKWEQEVKAEAEKLYSDRKREKTKALGEIAKLKKARQVKINSEAREMKNEALEKFHDAIYS